jgi:hypothetical protein
VVSRNQGRDFCPPIGTTAGLLHALNKSILRKTRELLFLNAIGAPSSADLVKGTTIYSPFSVLIHFHCLIFVHVTCFSHFRHQKPRRD